MLPNYEPELIDDILFMIDHPIYEQEVQKNDNKILSQLLGNIK